jgi:hypothetical protein
MGKYFHCPLSLPKFHVLDILNITIPNHKEHGILFQSIFTPCDFMMNFVTCLLEILIRLGKLLLLSHSICSKKIKLKSA